MLEALERRPCLGYFLDDADRLCFDPVQFDLLMSMFVFKTRDGVRLKMFRWSESEFLLELSFKRGDQALNVAIELFQQCRGNGYPMVERLRLSSRMSRRFGSGCKQPNVSDR